MTMKVIVFVISVAVMCSVEPCKKIMTTKEETYKWALLWIVKWTEKCSEPGVRFLECGYEPKLRRGYGTKKSLENEGRN